MIILIHPFCRNKQYTYPFLQLTGWYGDPTIWISHGDMCHGYKWGRLSQVRDNVQPRKEIKGRSDIESAAHASTQQLVLRTKSNNEIQMEYLNNEINASLDETMIHGIIVSCDTKPGAFLH